MVRSRATQPRSRLNRWRLTDVPIRIPVVVRDPQGHSVGGLRRQDFRLLVDGRPYPIADFAENLILPAPASAHAVTTLRYIALYFDDLHMTSTEIIRATDAADGYFVRHLGYWDRVGIFTASGQDTLDFTNNKLALHQTLMAIHAHPLNRTIGNACPPMSDFEGYLVLDLRQALAREVAIEDALQCMHLSGGGGKRPSLTALREAAQRADQQARVILRAQEHRSSELLANLGKLINHVAMLPDPRRIVVISPGFLNAVFERQINDIVWRASHLNIVISAMDISPQLRQLSFDALADSPAQAHEQALSVARYHMQMGRAAMGTEVLMQLAAGTGGNFVSNTYDAEFAFPKAVRLPRTHYVLTFYIPSYLANGNHHRVQVILLRHPGFSVQAEDSYFAPMLYQRTPSRMRRKGLRTVPRARLRAPHPAT